MLEWRKIPFVRLSIALTVGIILNVFAQGIPVTLVHISFILGLLILVLIFFTFKWRLLNGFIIHVCLLTLGFELAHFNNELNAPNHFKQYLNTENIILGVVTDKVEKQNSYRLTVSIRQIQDTSALLKEATGNLQVYIKKDSSHLPPQYGDLISLKSAIKPIKNALNPDAFDFQWYWHLQNVHYQCFSTFDDFKILAHEQGYTLMATALKWQQYFLDILKQHLNTGDEYAVAAALIVGNKEAITDEIKNAYIETGAMHILAISGMHFILIFKQIECFFDAFKIGNRRWRGLKAVILVVLIGLFTLLTGLSASIVRAAAMATASVLAKAIKRQVSIFNSIAASAFILLVWNPLWLFDIGFQLSYAAVLGIAFWGDRFQKIVALENKVLRRLWSDVSIGLVAQVAVAPLAIYYFHQIPIYFWLSGLLASIISEIALFVGILLLIFNKIAVLSYSLGQILFGSIWLMNNIIFKIQELPYSVLDDLALNIIEVIILYLFLIGIYIAFKKRLIRLLLYPLSMSLIFFILQAFSNFQNTSNGELIVYNIPKISLTEVNIGGICYSFSKKFLEKNTSTDRIKFATKNHHNSLKIKAIKQYNYNEYEKNSDLIYHNGYMAIKDLKLVLLDRLPQSKVSLTNCFVVVYGNPKFSIYQLKQVLDFKMAVFDASNSLYQIAKWREECDKMGFDYYDITTKGAWVHKF